MLRPLFIFKMGKQAQGAYMACPIRRPSPLKPSTVVLDSHYLHHTTCLLETGQVQQEEFTAVLAAICLHNQNQTTEERLVPHNRDVTELSGEERWPPVSGPDQPSCWTPEDSTTGIPSSLYSQHQELFQNSSTEVAEPRVTPDTLCYGHILPEEHSTLYTWTRVKPAPPQSPHLNLQAALKNPSPSRDYSSGPLSSLGK
ncbi:PREDICTED: uncharacterized protein LOC106727055 isoform X2 [Myotis brandtii]|uniref:uncharacterized protein LOC106727055 isoform X2 n=1 Tax=Myotis brandtii TaxID=109478 RepID=UPI0007045581|nr:PREDICTED: uncharacterized protein LOC106727055 isoform X2 [Myotis brandtii]